MKRLSGLPQVLEYESAATRLWATCSVDGIECQPDSAPTIEITDPDGGVLGSGSMTMDSVVGSANLNYDAQTATFVNGETITQTTSGATSTVVDDHSVGTTGYLELVDIDGTFVNDKALTGSRSGAAMANGACWSPTYYYSINASDTDTYAVGTGYQAKVTFLVGTVSYVRRIYFAVAYYPMCHPVITDRDISGLHPDWPRLRPPQVPDWSTMIQAGHAELVRRVNASGEFAQNYVARDDEWFLLELSFIEAQIAVSLGFAENDRTYYLGKRESAWSGRGLWTYSENDDGAPDADSSPHMTSCRLIR